MCRYKKISYFVIIFFEHSSQDFSLTRFLLDSAGFIQGMIQSLLACLQTGGVRKFKMFPKTLTMIWKQILEKTEQDSMRVAMPASTKILTACETKTKSKGFVTRLSLFDTGTDAYLRQDNSLFSSHLPSTMVINTAGPETLSASQTGLLNLLVKDDKGNMHQLMLENALVVPGLSQNLTSHKQFIENGHMVFFHKNQSGIVLNKQPKFRPDDVIIPFVRGDQGLYYLEEYVPEETSVLAMVHKKLLSWQWLLRE